MGFERGRRAEREKTREIILERLKENTRVRRAYKERGGPDYEEDRYRGRSYEDDELLALLDDKKEAVKK